MTEIDRREFLKIVGVGAGAAATAGCSDPVQKLVPYVVQPEEITPGIPVFYASTCQECPAACGLHVKTREGRPVKLEGNPEHPVNRGALCARGQAGLIRTYHPDRFRGPMRRGEDGELVPVTWEEATRLLAERIRGAGRGTRILGGPVGPTLDGLLDAFADAVGAGARLVYEPFAHEAYRAATRAVFGVDRQPLFDLEGADYVVDLGAEVLDTWLSPTEHARQLKAARDVATHPQGGARFVYVGPRLSMTAGNADEWLPARPGSEGILALAVARAAFERAREKGAAVGGDPALVESVLFAYEPESAAESTGVPAETIRRLGADLAAAERPVVLPPGVGLTGRRATATAAAVLVLNAVIGAVGRGVRIPAGDPEAPRGASFAEVQRFVKGLRDGAARVLLVHGANPAYSLPPELGFTEALERVDFVVSFASTPDETTAKADLVLPDHTPLESWGDAAPRPGVRSLVQPTVRPLYDTQALGDTLLAVGRQVGEGAAARLPQGSFRGILESAWSGAGADFREALARGGVFETPPEGPTPELVPGIVDLEFGDAPLDGDGDWVLLAHPSPLLGDGSGADLSWLQETPDPVTKIAWGSWAEISHRTAESLGVEYGDVVQVRTPAGRAELPVLPRGGIRDDVVAVALGQGHTVGRWASRDGEPRGVNAAALLPAATDASGARAWLTVRARLEPTGRHERPALTQRSDNKRGRQLGEAVSLAALAAGNGHGDGHGAEASHGGGHGETHEMREPYDPALDAVDDSPYRWGMTIDLDRCTGCSACVVACGLENNLPTVGEEGVRRGRQMQWLRIERYVGDGTMELDAGRPAPRDHETLGGTDVRHSPMLCQHCGAAPCEPVCPVYATYHSPEGLNGMIYNRCIGTRYCSNNCPYKVRRFNWFDYSLERWPKPLHLMANPDVTVRGQGVMEKCTFCVQRIQSARQTAKDEGRPIGDGEVTPACAQTCPTQALTFGNLRDEESRAVKQAKEAEPRAYHALHVLNTRPAITYLAKVRREAEGGEA